MILALALIFVLALLSVAITNLAVSEYATATGVDRSNQAFLAAEAGAERAIAFFRDPNNTDWSDDAPSCSGTVCVWQVLYTGVSFPVSGSGVAPVGEYSVSVRRVLSSEPRTNITIQAVGTVRGATRTIQLDLRRLTAADFSTYSVDTLDISKIPGGGSLTFHGSAYFEESLILKAGTNAGFYNDRFVVLGDSPMYMNHLYVKGDLDVQTGNPTISGTNYGSLNPASSSYYWLHVQGGVRGSSNNVIVSNFDKTVPAPFYPNVVQEAGRALDNPGNRLTSGSPVRLVVCRWQTGGGWTDDLTSSDLNLTGLAKTDTFLLPRQGVNCSDYPNSIPATRNGANYMLMWDAEDAVPLVLRNDSLPVYVPGKVLFGRDVRYEGKGTIVVGNKPTAANSSALDAQSGCAFDMNGNGSCNGSTSSGRWMRSRVSPCTGNPVDNPNSTYARDRDGAGADFADLAMFIVNGSGYSDLRASACDQEVNLVAIVGDRNCPVSAGVTCHFKAEKKLQWYGILMTKNMALGQVPDFWQMPGILEHIPDWAQGIFNRGTNPVLIRSWKELF